MLAKFDSEYRGTARAPEALRDASKGTVANITTPLPGLLTTLAGTVTGWSGNPTTAQVALAITDIRALTDVMEQLHGLVHKNRNGA